MKKRFIFVVRFIFLIVWIGIVGWIFLGHFFEHTIQKIDKTHNVTCVSSKTAKTVTIDMEGFHPEKITLHVCDTLIFKNSDTKYHQPAFGDHPKHLLYPGYLEKPLKPGETNLVVLTTYGTYKIHDHIYYELQVQLQILQ